jgi:16S rRNA processing protein RimM
MVEAVVHSVHPHKGAFLMKLSGIDTVEGAEAYRGASVLVRKDAFVHEREDEYFWHEIIGLRVYLDTGEYVGEVSHILPTGGSDLYVVRRGPSEVLIPAVHEVVLEIDLRNRRMTISDTRGLLELNEA